MSVRDKLLAAGVRNLGEFGYEHVTSENIITDIIYAGFFKSMLNDNLGQGFDAEIKGLLSEIDKADPDTTQDNLGGME